MTDRDYISGEYARAFAEAFAQAAQQSTAIDRQAPLIEGTSQKVDREPQETPEDRAERIWRITQAMSR